MFQIWKQRIQRWYSYLKQWTYRDFLVSVILLRYKIRDTMIIRPFGISVHLQTNPISTPHARVTEWRDVITKRATLLTTQTWSRSRPLSWADAIGRFWWQVVAIYRGRIEIYHSYGLRCHGLCCHLRHSTRGTGRRDGRSHSCCAGGVSTNHSSADRIVVNSPNHMGQPPRHCTLFSGWKYNCLF